MKTSVIPVIGYPSGASSLLSTSFVSTRIEVEVGCLDRPLLFKYVLGQD